MKQQRVIGNKLKILYLLIFSLLQKRILKMCAWLIINCTLKIKCILLLQLMQTQRSISARSSQLYKIAKSKMLI